MHKSISLFVGLIVGLVITDTVAQKLKYKDIYPLVSAKNYEEGIPKLKAYLSDPKNKLEANAVLQMGLYYEDQVLQLDLIKDSTEIILDSDSAIVYLQEAKRLIDEKELKKNDGYYQSFYRRDLRTGEFGIKISDVHLDIEKKLQSLESIVGYAHEIYKNLYTANTEDEYCFAQYTKFIAKYKTLNDLYLMSGSEEIATLKKMMEKDSDIKQRFNDVRGAVSRIGKKGYSPELNMNKINVYGVDGLTEVDFFQNDVEAWDYGDWAFQVKKVLEGDLAKTKEKLISFNKKLNAESELLKGLENTPFEKITHIIDPAIVESLKALDADPLPLTLFTIKIKKNEFDFITNPSLNPRVGEVDDVDFQLQITDSLVSILEEMEKDVAKLQEPYIMEGKKKYNDFVVNEYNGDFGLIKYRQQMETFLTNSKSNWNDKNKAYTLRAKWGVNVANDSIYLNPKTNPDFEKREWKKFYSIAFMKDDSSNTYVIGLEYAGTTAKGFIAMVSNARKIVWKENFDLNRLAYVNHRENIEALFVPSQSGRVAAYIYSPASASNNLVVVNANVVGQINWVNALKVDNKPVSVKFNDLVKETILYLKTEAEMETAGANEKLYYVIDRTGKVR